MQLEPINESLTRHLKLSMQRRIGWYLLACVLLMAFCGVVHYCALDQGIEIAPIIALVMALAPAGLVTLSIPALEWLHRDFQVRLTQSFYEKRYNATTSGEVGQLLQNLDRPPRSRREG